MGQISTLITGAGVNTSITGQAQLDQFLILGDIDTANALSGVKVTIDGENTIDVQGATFVNAISKFKQPLNAGVLGVQLKLATGRIYTPNASIILTNAGVTTPAIFSRSDNGNGRPVKASTGSINALSNQTFQGRDFDALFITSANIATIDLELMDGTYQSVSVVEADARFASNNATEANGRLDAAITTIDNTDKKLKSVRVNAAVGGAVTYAIMTV